MVETITKEELEQVRSSGGRICFTLCTDRKWVEVESKK